MWYRAQHFTFRAGTGRPVLLADTIAFAHARRPGTPLRSVRVLLSRFVGDEVLA